jgi:parvulin-like peptidyl-prolyl isomerase
MSIQHMRRRFAIQLRYVLWVIILAFIIGLPLIFVPGGFRSGQREEGQQQTGEADVVATVNGQPVTRADLNRSFDRFVSQILPYVGEQGIQLGQLWQLRYTGFEQAVQNRLLAEAAKAQGISVSKGDVKKQAQLMADQQIAQLKGQYRGADLERVFASIAAKVGDERVRSGSRGTPQTMDEREFGKWMMAKYLDESSGFREELAVQALRQKLTAQVSAGEQDLLQSYDKATVRHIVIMLHPAGKPARTEEQAKKRAEELLAKIKAGLPASGGRDFVALAKAESDDPGAKQSGGLMPNVGRGTMPAEWDKAVFALKPGAVSEPIQASSLGSTRDDPEALEGSWGYEIVRMETVARELPPDFEKNKQQLLSSFADQRRSEVWQKFVADLRQKAKLDIRDSELLAYKALAAGPPAASVASPPAGGRETKWTDEVLAKLEEAKTEVRNEGGPAAASVFYQVGSLLAGKKEWEGAADAFAEASDALSEEYTALLPGGRAEALVAMANAYEQQGNTKEALVWYEAARDQTELPSIHSQLMATFQRLGRPDLVKQEQQWMANYQQEQRDREAEMAAQRKAAEQKSPGKAPSAPSGPPVIRREANPLTPAVPKPAPPR